MFLLKGWTVKVKSGANYQKFHASGQRKRDINAQSLDVNRCTDWFQMFVEKGMGRVVTAVRFERSSHLGIALEANQGSHRYNLVKRKRFADLYRCSYYRAFDFWGQNILHGVTTPESFICR